jgi:hypothetical protein
MSPIGYPAGVCTGKIRINGLMPELSGLIRTRPNSEA